MAQVFNTSKIVFMEVSSNTTMENLYGIAEARWVQHLSETTQPLIRGIVARCPLEAGVVVESCLQEVATIPKVRGIRSDFTTQSTPSGLVLSPSFVDGVKLLSKYNLSFDLLVSTELLPLATELARAAPDVIFIVDHMGGPNISNVRSLLLERATTYRTCVLTCTMCLSVRCLMSGIAI